MSQDGECAYDNTHRAFLQAFIARSTFTYPTAKPVLAKIFSAHEGREILAEDITQSDFNSYVSSLNAAISQFDFEIRSTLPQTSPATRIYAFVNTTSDPITQLATLHTPDEIAYVKRVLDGMFETNNTPQREIMAIKGMDATRLNRNAHGTRNSGVNGNSEDSGITNPNTHGITMREAEKLLKSLVEEGWFEKHREYYSLSPRALMELRGWLLETYNEPEDGDGGGGVERIKLCQACKEIVTVGQRCSTRACLCRLHDHCTGNFFTATREERCPICKVEWTGNNFVGVKADGRGGGRESTNGLGSRNTNGRTNSNSNRRSSTKGMEEEGAEASPTLD